MFASGDMENSLLAMEEAAGHGCDMATLVVHLSDVYASREDMDADTQEGWARYDQLIEAMARHFPWLSFRLHLNYTAKAIIRNALDKGKTPVFGFHEMMKDQWGNRECLQMHEGPGCFAIPEVRDREVDFVRRFVRRYAGLADRFRWVGVSMSNAQETEYPHGNRGFVDRAKDEAFWQYFDRWPAAQARLRKTEDFWPEEHGEWPTRFDYHPALEPAFRGYVMMKYRTIQELNAAWGTRLADWEQVRPPRIACPDIRTSCFEDWRLLFQTRPGVDWYRFSYENLKDFVLRCRGAMREVRSDIPLCTEFGSCTDPLGVLRGNYDIPDMNGWVDVLKTGQAGINWGGERMIDGDLTRANFRGARHMEVNENDVPTQSNPRITEPGAVKHEMRQMAERVYRNGVECVILIARRGSEYYRNTLALAGELRAFADTRPEPNRVVGAIHSSVEELITNYGGVWQAWRDASAGLDLSERIDVRLL